MKFALLIPVIVAVSLSAVDYAWTINHKAVLQDAADIAALAGAKELSLSDSKKENVTAVVEAMVTRYIAENSSSLKNKNARPPTVTASVTDDPLEVEVRISQPVDALVGSSFGLEFPDLAIRSVARVVGQPNICALALAVYGTGGAVWLTKDAKMTGNNCSVFSNSTQPGGIIVRDRAVLRASAICSAGGFEGGGGNFVPAPLSDCPVFDDPLEDRSEPTVGLCTATDTVIANQFTTLSPGTYCGGLTISGNSQVTFAPGVYVIKDGPFKVTDSASISGTGTGFYLTGRGSIVNFDFDTSIDLGAPSTGIMAGILFFGARSQSVLMLNRIKSNNARNLLGTIYFPRSSLQVDADNSVADESAYTAIVANRILLMEGPHLVLNTDYDKTTVPVPKGIRGAGQPVSLVE